MIILNIYVLLNVLLGSFVISALRQEKKELTDIPMGDLEFYHSTEWKDLWFLILFPGAGLMLFGWRLICSVINRRFY
jgi:hypothetical protein